ncbi:hypothetical protein BX616_004992 [Lobosporangium transversale]|nr:hypothetical protein BX616_004992 [Lobosporangium transversale]
MFCFGALYVIIYGSSHYIKTAPVITGAAIVFSCMGLVPFFTLMALIVGAMALLYFLYILFLCLFWPLEKCGLSRRRAISRRNGGYRSNGTTNTTDLRQIEQAIIDAENGEAGGGNDSGDGRGVDRTYKIKMTPAMAAIPIVIFRKPQLRSTAEQGLTAIQQQHNLKAQIAAHSLVRQSIIEKYEPPPSDTEQDMESTSAINKSENEGEGNSISVQLSGEQFNSSEINNCHTSSTSPETGPLQASTVAASFGPRATTVENEFEQANSRPITRPGTPFPFTGSDSRNIYANITSTPDSILKDPLNKANINAEETALASKSTGSGSAPAIGSGSWSGSGAEMDRYILNDYPTIDDEECAICLSVFEDGDELRHLYCNHFFHRGCVDRWLAKHPFCPKCKRHI